MSPQSFTTCVGTTPSEAPQLAFVVDGRDYISPPISERYAAADSREPGAAGR